MSGPLEARPSAGKNGSRLLGGYRRDGGGGGREVEGRHIERERGGGGGGRRQMKGVKGKEINVQKESVGKKEK